MDSLTQIVLGSTVAALAVPNHQRRSALIAGAVLATLPDLDVIGFELFHSDVITTMTWHRGPSHSLIVLAIFGWLLWLLLKRFKTPIKEAPRSWLLAIWLALLTHPILDAFTIYGTQLLWPLQIPPIMWGTIFIIDPLYTLPLLIGVTIAWFKSNQTSTLCDQLKAHRWLIASLTLSSIYLLWSVVAQLWIDQIATRSLAPMGLKNAPRFSTPTPLNTLLWRTIVMVPDGYYASDYSLIADREAMIFTFYPSDIKALEQLSSTFELNRLLWFTHGFVAVQINEEQRLIVSDLRMGLEPNYIFSFDIAIRDKQNNWALAVPIKRMPAVTIDTSYSKTFTWIWHRIWNKEDLLL